MKPALLIAAACVLVGAVLIGYFEHEKAVRREYEEVKGQYLAARRNYGSSWFYIETYADTWARLNENSKHGEATEAAVSEARARLDKAKQEREEYHKQVQDLAARLKIVAHSAGLPGVEAIDGSNPLPQ